MIKNILFDTEGVLLDFSPEAILRRLKVPEEDIPLLREAVFRSPERITLQRDGITLEKAVDTIAAGLPLGLRSWAGQALADWWKYPLDPVPGMAELMGELKDLGYKLYLFANADRAIHAYAHRIPGARYFDGLFASSDWKLLQPEPAIYDAFLGKFGLTSWECLLIDNSPANVDGARRADMDAVLFRGDMGRLRSELNALGVGVKTGTEG